MFLRCSASCAPGVDEICFSEAAEGVATRWLLFKLHIMILSKLHRSRSMIGETGADGGYVKIGYFENASQEM